MAVEPLRGSPIPTGDEVGPLVLQILQPQGAGDEAGDKSATASSEDSLDPRQGLSKSSPRWLIGRRKGTPLHQKSF